MEVRDTSGQSLAEEKSADKRIRGSGLGPMLLVGVVAILLVFHGFRKARFQTGRTSPGDVTLQHSHAQLDPNTANARELGLIPGLGPSLAEKLVQFRREKRLTQPEDLLGIQGIGPATITKIRDWFVWEEGFSANGGQQFPAEKITEKSQGKMPALRTPKLKSGDPKLDLNSAAADDLLRLPGVGPVLVRRIIEEREIKPFSSVDDLMRVPGIGPKTFDKIKLMVKIGDSKKTGE